MACRLNNLVFISGPQGSGKSTLISHLTEEIPDAISPELKTKSPQFYWGGDENVLKTNFFHRQALKYAQRASENYEYFAAAKREPGKLIIGDRCRYDTCIYRIAGIKLGWISKEQDIEIEEKLRILNLDELMEPFCIILNPGFESCQNHLQKRWNETGWIKFMETNMNYLKEVCESFQELKSINNILYIGENIDYSKKCALDNIKNWIKGFYNNCLEK